MYEFVSGPLVWIAFILFIAGLGSSLCVCAKWPRRPKSVSEREKQ